MTQRLYRDIGYFLVSFFIVTIFIYFFITISKAVQAGGGEPNPDPNPGIPADLVLGQTTFSANSVNQGGSVAANTMNQPRGVFTDGTNLYVADTSNHRVLIWTTTTPGNGADATIVLGQADFTSNAANRGGSVSSSTLSQPEEVYSDGSKLYVADYANNRVLIWNTTTPATGSGATIVLGQADFTSNAANRGGSTSSSTLFNPQGIFSTGSKIYVADGGNSRLLIWNTASPTIGVGADVVLGQANFTENDSHAGATTAATLFSPEGVYVDGLRIYVADNGNHRVVIWDTVSPTTGASANRVIGQPDFTTTNGDISESKLNSPRSVYADANNIFVADSGNNRVVIWTTTTPANGASATAVVGRSSLTSATPYDPSTTTVSQAYSVVYRSGKLYVADYGNNRVLRFDMNAATPGAPTVASAATSSFAVTVSSTSNPPMTQYAIYDSGTGSYVSAGGTLSSAAVFQTTSTWSNSISVTGLTPGQQYTFGVVGHFIAGLDTTTSTATSLFTLANRASAPSVTASTSAALNITINTNSNPPAVTYAVFNTTTGNYLTTTGTATTTAIFTATSTFGPNFAAIGLSPDTAYQFVVIARNGDGINAATSSANTAVYTLANAPGTPTVTASSTTALQLVINQNSNPSSVNYSLCQTTSGTSCVSGGYVQTTGALGASAAWQSYESWGGASGVSVVGLTANGVYQFLVQARNGSSVTTSLSSASTAVYTKANTPSSVSATAGSASAITVNWSGDATEYYVDNVTAGTNSGWTTSTSYTFSGLTCATAYSFQVKGRNGDSVETSASSASATTNACPSSGGGVSPNTSHPPQVPTETKGQPGQSQSGTFEFRHAVHIFIGGESHVVTVENMTNDTCTFEIQSDPIIVTVNRGIPRDIDTNNDGRNDIRVVYEGLVQGKPKLTFAPLYYRQAVIMNDGESETSLPTVRLTFTVTGANQMALSNTPDFAGASFVPYQSSVSWTLSPGDGQKMVYVRFRSSSGGVTEASGSITLRMKTTPSVETRVYSSTGESRPLPQIRFTRTLQYGSRGGDVIALQQKLRELGYFSYKSNTGFYGPVTKTSVKKFQRAHALPQVGVVGPLTRHALNNL